MMSPSRKEVLVLAPVLNFITRFAMQSDTACRTATDVGSLNILLHIYIVFPTLSNSTQEDFDRKLALRDACRSILGVLCLSQHQGVVLKHPICILWSDLHSQLPGYSTDASTDPVQVRSTAWRGVEKSCVDRRALAIYRYSLWKPPESSLEVCIDIVEFTR
jgi:hypothetical protein